MRSFLFFLFLLIYASASAVDGKKRIEFDIQYAPSGSLLLLTKDLSFFNTFIQQVKLAFGEINTEEIKEKKGTKEGDWYAHCYPSGHLKSSISTRNRNTRINPRTPFRTMMLK